MADYNTVLPPSKYDSSDNPVESLTHNPNCSGYGMYLGRCECKPGERINRIASIMNTYHNEPKVITYCRNELQKIADDPSNVKNPHLSIELRKYGIGPTLLCTYTDPKYTASIIEMNTHTLKCNGKTANSCNCVPEERTHLINHLIYKYRNEKDILSHLERIRNNYNSSQRKLATSMLKQENTMDDEKIEQQTHSSTCPLGRGYVYSICNCKPEDRIQLAQTMMNVYRNNPKIVGFCQSIIMSLQGNLYFNINKPHMKLQDIPTTEKKKEREELLRRNRTIRMHQDENEIQELVFTNGIPEYHRLSPQIIKMSHLYNCGKRHDIKNTCNCNKQDRIKMIKDLIYNEELSDLSLPRGLLPILDLLRGSCAIFQVRKSYTPPMQIPPNPASDDRFPNMLGLPTIDTARQTLNNTGIYNPQTHRESHIPSEIPADFELGTHLDYCSKKQNKGACTCNISERVKYLRDLLGPPRRSAKCIIKWINMILTSLTGEIIPFDYY
jgi:hypothetical protein